MIDGAPSLAAIEGRIAALRDDPGPPHEALAELLRHGESIVEYWLAAHDQTPTRRTKEGFRLLALQAQGARLDPTFNACRETCRELVFHYNLVAAAPNDPQVEHRTRLAAMVAMHICLFVGGKLEEAGLGEFCCAARPLRNRAG